MVLMSLVEVKIIIMVLEKTLQDKIIDEVDCSLCEYRTTVKLKLTIKTQHMKRVQSSKNLIGNKFNDFRKEIILKVVKELSKANNSLKESVDVSLKAFDMSLKSSLTKIKSFWIILLKLQYK